MIGIHSYLLLFHTPQDGFSALACACLEGLHDIADMLISKGADINIIENVSYNLFLIVIINMCINVFSYLGIFT